MPSSTPLPGLLLSPICCPIKLPLLRRNSIVRSDVASGFAAMAPGGVVLVLVGLWVQTPGGGENERQVWAEGGVEGGAAGAVAGVDEEEGEEEGCEEEGCEYDLIKSVSPSTICLCSGVGVLGLPFSTAALARRPRRMLCSGWERVGVLRRAWQIRRHGVSWSCAAWREEREAGWEAGRACGGARVRSPLLDHLL